VQNYCNIVKNKLNMLIRNMEKNVSVFVVDPKRDFIRKSELSFSKTMRFILGMGSQTLSKKLMEFYGFDSKMVSVSAIVQRRAKILPTAFQHLFHKFNGPSHRQISLTVTGFMLWTVLIFLLFLMITALITTSMLIPRVTILCT